MPAGTCVRSFAVALLVSALTGCYLDNPGDTPSQATLYFPNAIALSQQTDDAGAARFLFVANSNFDLRYRGGTLQAFDLAGLERAVRACKQDDCTVATASVLAGEVLIGSFSTGLALSADGKRVVFTTRTDDNLGFVRIDASAKLPPDGPGILRCAAADDTPPCSLAGREDDRDADVATPLDWPAEPAAVLAGKLSDFAPNLTLPAAQDAYVLVAHRSGQMSLFVEDVEQPAGGYAMSDVLQLGAPAASKLAFDPSTQFVYAAPALSSSSARLYRVRAEVPTTDGEPTPSQAFLGASSNVPVLDGFPELRDLSFLPALGGGAAAFSTPSALLLAGHPGALFVAGLPQQDDTGRPASARVKDVAVLGSGATRFAAAVVDGVPLAVVASFDAREVDVVDLRTMLTRSVQPNLSGPFDVSIDAARRLVYVADFRSSVLRVIDLAPLLDDGGDGSISVVATVGTPRILQELQ